MQLTLEATELSVSNTSNTAAVSKLGFMSKSFAKRSVNKAVEQYQQLENKALDALKTRLPKPVALEAQSSQQQIVLLRKLNDDISKSIETTVAAYLPKIEAELRKTLELEAKQHIQQLRKLHQNA